MNNEEPLFNQFEEDPLFDYELENEMLLIKLQAEFGGAPEFVDADVNGELDAHIKYDFLKSIYSFEEHFSGQLPMISLFEHLGQPYMIDEKYLTDEGVSSQLQRVERIMEERQFIVDTIYPIPDRTRYRFILEELLQVEVESSFPAGFFRHFIYEEFHPNHQRDIEEQVVQFFREFSEQAIPSSCFYLSDEIVVGDVLFTRDEVVNRLMLFSGLFASLEITKLEVTAIEISNEKARVQFVISYNGLVSENEVVKVDQSGQLGMIYREQLIWQIDALDIPGVVF
ncbi:MAG TPA: hypothetical protein VLC28_08665 [Flavitalea sp.]|nr:hypothetical protein [Flavitalea sp.]